MNDDNVSPYLLRPLRSLAEVQRLRGMNAPAFERDDGLMYSDWDGGEDQVEADKARALVSRIRNA